MTKQRRYRFCRYLLIGVFMLMVMYGCGKDRINKTPSESVKKPSESELPIECEQPSESELPTENEKPKESEQPAENVKPYYHEGTYVDIDFSGVFDFSNAGKSEDNPEMRMAHNIYSDPDLSKTSGNFQSFMIDFKSDHAPTTTYWALCNWSMDLSSLRKKYSNVEGGGAYCGLQVTEAGTKAIMSFWEINCDGTVITPSLVYPVKDGNGHFDNEGSGANYIPDYAWEKGRWYRMYLNCYDDSATGNTFVEMWLKDIERGQWEKICCYDTKLQKSCLQGGMSQFMENYYYLYSNEVRSCQFANLFVKEYKSGEWIPITSSRMSIDTWWDNKKGTYNFGSTETNLWGITCGYGADTAVMNSDVSSKENVLLTLEIPDVPDGQ